MKALNTINSILFDLDGTLLDTAPDLAFALNQLRLQYHLPALPFERIRPLVGHGAKALIHLGFNITEEHEQYTLLLNQFLLLYEKHVLDSTTFFPDMEAVLAHLTALKMPWGIVTNKPSKFVLCLAKKFSLARAACVVCGDTLSTRKPHPGTILYACQQLKKSPSQCLYVGDSSIDVMASKAAGTKSLVALYGYRHEEEDPFTWQADGYIEKPSDMIEWLDINGYLPHQSSLFPLI